MNNRIFIVLIIIILPLTSGCDFFDSINTKISNYIAEKDVENNSTNTVTSEEVIDNRPVADKISYFFGTRDKITKGLNEFILYSEKYSYCVFSSLEDQSIADSLITVRQKEYTVKVILDKTNSMTQCDVSCIPKLESMYMPLFEKRVDVKLREVHENFCVTDRGLALMSSSFASNMSDYRDTMLIIYSEELRQKFVSEFDFLWE